MAFFISLHVDVGGGESRRGCEGVLPHCMVPVTRKNVVDETDDIMQDSLDMHVSIAVLGSVVDIYAYMGDV